ncbi:MAG: hypothetical protein L0213_07715, partial [Candidatus Dadabacteria bacterium]|nr:hypothetical protein [Candidatus Dadabacteria bacterium]
SGRLLDMIESMEQRGSPLNAHRVATRYFDSFRKERNIHGEADDGDPATETSRAPDTALDTMIITAVDSAVKKGERRKSSPAEPGVQSADLKDLDSGFTPSESRVYSAMYNKSIEKKAPTLRLGLKELKDLTGLSDKTVRVAIHSLEKKLALKVVESSLGIYGRKFSVPTPGEVLEERLRAGLEIDPTTKKVIDPAAPVSTAVDIAVNTAISNAVHTTVITAVIDTMASRNIADDVLSLYEFYTGNKPGGKDEEYFERIKHLNPRVVEAALILTSLKGKGGITEFSQVGGVLEDLEEELPEGYLEPLRGAWNALYGGE